MNRPKHLAVLVGALAVSMTYVGGATPAQGGQSPLSEEVIAWSVGTEEDDHGEDGDDAHDIWLMQGDGTAKVQLSSDDGSESWPRWSFDGSRLAWRGLNIDDETELDSDDWDDMWVGGRDGSGITTAAQPGTAFIVPSPNAQRFATHAQGDIRVTSFAGGAGANITSGGSTDDGFASWSPDGSRLVYKTNANESGPDNPSHIAVRNADGTGFDMLTEDDAFNDRFPQWSPTSNQIVFGRSPFVDDGPDDDDIWIMNADGTGLTNLTDGDASDSYSFPRWSPDGSLIAYNFLSAANAGDEDSQQEVWVMNPDGTGKRRLDSEALQGSSGFWGFSWSPDGSQIVYKLNDDETEEMRGLAVVDVASGDLVVQTPDGIWANVPDWSANGNWIVYEAAFERDEATEIFVIAAQSGAEPIRLTGTEEEDDVADEVWDEKPVIAPAASQAPIPTEPPAARPAEAAPTFTG